MSDTKPYDTEGHLAIKTVIAEQIEYVNTTLKGEQVRVTPDIMSLALTELTGFYEYLSTWLADERFHLADLKMACDLHLADEFLKNKKLHDTNEVARMKAKLECAGDQVELDKYRHGYDVIEAWKKTIGRYHDGLRSQLSYEKQMAGMGRFGGGA